jgi:surfactin synthase thioesterase subunit
MESFDDNLWFRRYAPADEADQRLVCFPHAGGSASYFLPVARTLAPQVDVLSVQYPGRQDRRVEAAYTDIGALAESIHHGLTRWTDRPLSFFGHSMGALVAFEVARRFGEGSGQPVHLYVSGRRAPSTHRTENLHLLDDAGIATEIRSLGGTEAALLADSELMAMVIPTLRSDYQAAETYDCPPDRTVRCPVTALVGQSDPRATLAEVQKWEEHTTGTFDLKVYSGGHFYLTDHVTDVIDLLAEHFSARTAGRA